jgi:hypothetical protein
VFFTKAGSIVAWLCVVGGLLHWGYLVSLTTQSGGPLPLEHPMWQKVLAAASTDQNLIAFGIVLGIFAEISKSLAALAAPTLSPEDDSSKH